MEETRETIRSLKNDIEQAGGGRLREVGFLIERERERAEVKRRAEAEYTAALNVLEIEKSFANERGFAELKQRLPGVRQELESAAVQTSADRDERVLERGEIRRNLAALREEWEGLERRNENVPQWCVALRHQLCDELGLAARELPFAAELMQVRPKERAWEPSLEKVLRGFALSLLVPEKYYRLIAAHVDRTRLSAEGRGQRLAYLRVAEQAAAEEPATRDPRALVHKLNFRLGHGLAPWVKAEVERHFNYLCCESVAEFEAIQGRALTRNRHVKSGRERHEKDDRDQTIDPRHFVLGWDNRENKRHIASEIERLAERETQVNLLLDAAERKAATLQARLAAVAKALLVADFAEIDVRAHEWEIEAIEHERRRIEDGSDVIRALKKRLAEVEARATALEARREDLIGRQRELENHIADAKRLLANAQSEIVLAECSS